MGYYIFHIIFIWYGLPRPHLRRSRFAVGILLFKNNQPFSKRSVFDHRCQYVAFLFIFGKHQIDVERNSMQKMCRKCVLSSHIDLLGDQMMSNNFRYIVYIFVISGTVPTYGTAYVPTVRTA